MLDIQRFKGQKIKCAGVGEVLFDVYPTGAKIGGAPANFAYFCMLHSLKALVISAVGHDALGFEARNYLAARFLPALLMDSDRPTGTVNVELSEDSVPAYTFASDTAYDNIRVNSAVLDTVKTLNMICFGTLAQRSEISHQSIMQILDAMPKDSIRIYDVNLRREFYSKKIIADSMARAEVLKCNEDELPVLAEIAGLKDASPAEYRRYLKDKGIDCFIFTEGAKQSTVWLNEEKSVLPTPKVEAIDTVGAGDSFTATVISCLMQGMELKKAHAAAARVSAYVCTQRGAMPDVPANLISKF